MHVLCIFLLCVHFYLVVIRSAHPITAIYFISGSPILLRAVWPKRAGQGLLAQDRPFSGSACLFSRTSTKYLSVVSYRSLRRTSTWSAVAICHPLSFLLSYFHVDYVSQYSMRGSIFCAVLSPIFDILEIRPHEK